MATSDESKDRIDPILERMRRDREDWARRREEQEQVWAEFRREREESDRRWWERQREISARLDDIERLGHKSDCSWMALEVVGGVRSQASFHKELVGMLEERLSAPVVSVVEYDEKGEVFGHPDHVEIDIVEREGVLVAAEIRWSMSKADVYFFERSVRFYEKRHQKSFNRIIVTSPMVDDKAREFADWLGIEVYSHPGAVAPSVFE